MKNFNEMTLEERQEITALFHCWLKNYTHLISDFEAFKRYDIHNHPLTHSQSYRDILHDMYL